MTPQTENAIRSVAKNCRAEMIVAMKGKLSTEKDAISTAILDKYAKKITCLPPGRFSERMWLCYYVSQLSKGR